MTTIILYWIICDLITLGIWFNSKNISNRALLVGFILAGFIIPIALGMLLDDAMQKVGLDKDLYDKDSPED